VRPLTAIERLSRDGWRLEPDHERLRHKGGAAVEWRYGLWVATKSYGPTRGFLRRADAVQWAAKP